MSSLISLSDIAIRHQLQPGDIGTVIALHGRLYYDQFGFGLGFEHYVAETFAAFVGQFKPGRDRIWMAEHQGDPAGFISLVHRSEQQAQLRYFIIAPKYRGLGLGSLLFRTCMDSARQYGYESVYLWTTSLLVQAGAMYRKEGFELVEEQCSSSFGVPMVEQKYELKL
ncbi:MAG: GNAT family N-acetyltransferase [Lunatimonas sp.]|uniref:GNAT family N-acetyltransferase n=1 Tax=Lunatimonas sp. TaxID=2060141 RepID=UPI00263B243C|nr:GNAT family N-acetyltransferase [Lunatimonas sp.]MCC5938618.1 GNAT family N-acetyltransferase [Lunatimonas sp.]